MAEPASAPGPVKAPGGGWHRLLGVSAATALIYVLAAKLALLLAIPPGYASPLYPPAGLALAAVLVYGRQALPGVLLGSLLVNLPLAGSARALSPMLAPWLPLVPALGATLQVALGAWLVTRRVQQPLTLSEPRDIARFFLYGALLSCCVNASVSTLALAGAGVVPTEALALTWWTWWGGDALGVLIATPVALTLIGLPRDDWRHRRTTVALPLLVTTALLALATVMIGRGDLQRAQGGFERDANAAAASLRFQLHDALQALQAMEGLFVGSELVTAEEFKAAAQPWLKDSTSLRALGYSDRVQRRQLAGYQADVERSDHRRYQVFDRSAPAESAVPENDDPMVVVRYIEPMAGNDAVLGLNSRSVPAARAAIDQSVAQGQASASSGFWISQPQDDQTGVVIYRALYLGQPAQTAQARQSAFRGVVFATLHLPQLMSQAMRDAPPYLGWCLLDLNPLAPRRQLAGAPGCVEQLAQATDPRSLLRQDHVFSVAGQQWQLHLSSPTARVPDTGQSNAWLFSTAGLGCAALLAALLLTVTGRTRRIETAVAERTADLQHEMAERARTESALRQSEQRFRNIFDHAPVGIAIAALDGRITEANPRLWEMLGHAAPASGQPVPVPVLMAERPETLSSSLPALLAGQTSKLHHRSRLAHANGSALWVQVNWSVLRDAQGRPHQLVAVAEDITEHLRLQESEQGRRLAESANLAKNEFLSRMSHELRTPLNAMLGFAQLLEMDRKPGLALHQQGWTRQVLQAGWHLLEMINDTLDLSRIDAGQIKLDTQRVHLPPLLAQCVAMVQAQADRRQISISLDLADDADHAWCDATRLRQVLTNLLSNAVKYNLDGGRVRVTSHRLDHTRLALRVTDTGLGLSPAQLAELFQPFNRLGREGGASEGTGIGLVISRRLAELMGGRLDAQAEAEQGASFVLQLPLAQAQRPGAGPQTETPAPAGSYGERRVHYIEDNGTNVEVMRGILSHRPQIRLEVSGLGLTGLDALRQQQPDLLLLDMHLPDIDGLTLLQRLKADPATAPIPVLVVSADATPQRIEQALAAGALQYLSKPLDLDGFLALVDRMLGEVKPGPHQSP